MEDTNYLGILLHEIMFVCLCLLTLLSICHLSVYLPDINSFIVLYCSYTIIWWETREEHHCVFATHFCATIISPKYFQWFTYKHGTHSSVSLLLG